MPSDTSKARDLIGNEPTEEQHKQSLLQEEDDDVSTPVSSNVYEMSFEEALAVTPASSDDENGLMNWYIPNDRRMPAIIRKLAEDTETSFTVVVGVAVVHGFSIFKHQRADLLTLLTSLDNVAITDANSTYFDHLNQRTILGKNIKRLPMSAPKALMNEMGQTAAMVGAGRSHLAGACVLLSLLTSELVDQKSKDYMNDFLKTFNVCLTIFESNATTLIGMTK